MPVFEVLVIERPTKKAAEEEGALEEVLSGPRMVVAKDGQSAALAATIGDTKLAERDLKRVEVIVRPFV